MYTDELKLYSIIDMFLNCKVSHVYTIFAANYSSKKRIDKIILEKLEDKSTDIAQLNNGTQLRVFNKNNSAMLKVVIATPNVRGYRSLLSLYDDACSEEFIKDIIQSISCFCMGFNIDNI